MEKKLENTTIINSRRMVSSTHVELPISLNLIWILIVSQVFAFNMFFKLFEIDWYFWFYCFYFQQFILGLVSAFKAKGYPWEKGNILANVYTVKI